MHLPRPVLLFTVLLLFVAAPAFADDFSLVVSDVNSYFSLHRDDFRMQVAAEFGISAPRIDRLVATVGSAGDAYLCLEASRSSGRSLDEVTRTWQRQHKRGWGAVAQELGIKPGSDAFMQLKRHNLKAKHRERHDDEHGKGSKSKDKGKEKGKGKKD